MSLVLTYISPPPSHPYVHLVSELDHSGEEIGEETDKRSKAQTHSLQK